MRYQVLCVCDEDVGSGRGACNAHVIVVPEAVSRITNDLLDGHIQFLGNFEVFAKVCRPDVCMHLDFDCILAKIPELDGPTSFG